MIEIYLIRHTSVDVPAGYVYGQTDVPLKASFEEEAAKVKEGLDGSRFDKVFTSPLSRCVRLASFCGYPEAEREERIKEINFGEWEMLPWDSISSDPRSKVWFQDWIHVSTPGGESLQEQFERVSDFLDGLRTGDARKVCLFTHGGVLTCARVYAGEYPLREAFRHVPPYGSIIRIEI